MSSQVYVFDPTATDEMSKVRGVGRYLQILKENFPNWTFTSEVSSIQQEGDDTVFINPFFNPYQPPVISKKFFPKQIVVIHDVIPLKYSAHFPAGLKGKLQLLSNKKALDHYDVVVTDSEASKNDIEEHLKVLETKIQVVYPCLPKIFTQPPVISSGTRNPVKRKTRSRSSVQDEVVQDDKERNNVPSNYFLYVGDATWNKNLVNLAKAIKAADVNCVFVGRIFGQMNRLTSPENPWQKELVEFSNLVKGDPRFVFPGFITDGELVNLYKNALVNVLVSRDEGFGFSFLEASSQEIPSLLGDIAVLHEISQDAALFVDEQKPDEIADKMKALVENEDLRKTLGQEAKERSRFFSAERFTSDFKKFLH